MVLGSYPTKASGDARLSSVYNLYKDSLDTADFEPTDSCSHEEAISKQDFGINDQISSQMIQILWRLLSHGFIGYHGVVVDTVKREHSPIPINPLNWQLTGLTLLRIKQVPSNLLRNALESLIAIKALNLFPYSGAESCSWTI